MNGRVKMLLIQETKHKNDNEHPHYDRMMMPSVNYDKEEMNYPHRQYPPPMYDYSPERRIGFGGNSETKGDRSESNSRNIQFYGSHHDNRHSEGVTKEKAHEWVKQMKNSDGSTGAHWDMAQTNSLKERHGINIDPVEFYVAVNMMYSDYCGIAKKYGVDNADFYAHMAKAFLDDKDAGPDKLERYFDEVVKVTE